MPLSPSPRSAELATVRVCVASSQEKSKAAAAAEGTNAIEQKEEADANPASNAERSLRGRCSFIPEFLYFMRKKSLLSTRKYSITKIPLSCPDTFIKTHVKPFSVILIAKQRKKSLRLTIPQFVNSMAEELKATAPADKKHSKTKKTTTKRPETYLSSLLPAL